MAHRRPARIPPRSPWFALWLLLTGALSGGVLGAQGSGAVQGPEPRARRLARELCEVPRLAGTRGSLRAALWVADRLREAGYQVELDRRRVLLSHPERLEIRAWTEARPGLRASRTLFHRVETFDVAARPPGDVPKYNAWSASGTAEGAVLDVGRGLRDDYEQLAAEGVDPRGRIALARYGGAYRGVKAELAQEFGCAGLLLFSDPAEDGPARGATWPAGPWKPGHDAQRGAISGLAIVPGDPSTPGWASPASQEKEAQRPRLGLDALETSLPAIPCLPIGSTEAMALIAAGDSARVALDLEVPRRVREIVNVIGRLEGLGPDYVLAGNHRDAWVRGTQDAGSGTVSLLLAAERLGQLVRAGWRPAHGIVLAFWDAEEFGLIGSTEWGEAQADELRQHGLAYVNADAVVSGPNFGASGTPGLEGLLRSALERVPAPQSEHETLLGPWLAKEEGEPALGLPGSGSDYTVFLHHLGLPVLDISFGGNPGGQYHTAFDDFPMMDRFLDPTWEGHGTAGHLLAELLQLLADRGRAGFDDGVAAQRMARVAREAGDAWLPGIHAEAIAQAFESLAQAIEGVAPRPGGGRDAPAAFYRSLERPDGLADRPWYRNRLWAPGLETGYAAVTFPSLRLALKEGEEELAREARDIVDSVGRLEALWRGIDPETDHGAAEVMDEQ